MKDLPYHAKSQAQLGKYPLQKCSQGCLGQSINQYTPHRWSHSASSFYDSALWAQMCLTVKYYLTRYRCIPERFSSKMVLFLLIKSQKNGRTVRLNDSKHTGSLQLETWLELAKPSNPFWEGYWHQHSLDKFYEVRGGFSNILKHGCFFFFPLYIFALFWKNKTFSYILVLFLFDLLIHRSDKSTECISTVDAGGHQRSYALKDYMMQSFLIEVIKHLR